ncbi:D-alanyl-D-alanine carboxypeptidase family protein [Streptomyces sp. NPDC085524]|uniref:D-alanyl-D-alanine carboxypeptidase family protein n=1 Tax=Streptomyces sp. NPDC085524 TaxID=3365728 RepID=UPI0037D6AD50
MAGESPDKSVDEGTPGAVESSERDPRLSVFRPREPEGGSGAPAKVDADSGDAGSGGEPAGPDLLREAVAAWVASAEAESSGPDADAGADADADADAAGAAGEPGSAPAEGGASAAAASDAGKPAADAAKPAPAAEAGKPGSGSAPDGAAADAAKPAPAAGNSDSAPGAGGAGAEAAKPADSERTAVFRAVKQDSGSGSGPASGVADSAKSGAGAAADAGKPASPAGGSADSERTAVFRAVKPGSGSATGGAVADAVKSGPGAAAGAGKPASGAAPAAGKPAADEPADSERTAVFRAFERGSGSASAGAVADSAKSGAGAAADAGKPASSAAPAAGKPAADEPADSERTAVFRAVKPGSGSAPAPAKPAAGKSAPAPAKPAAGEPADSERTAVFRVPKPGSAGPAAGARPGSAVPAAGDRPGGAAPKDSTFVPLRTDDAEAGQQQPKAAAASAAAPAIAPRPPADHSERTTQQPLPPRPPLDLLADLTNNPPPPPSPMRTAVRRLKIYTPIVLLLAIILAVVQLVRPLPQPKLVMTAKSSFTFDGSAPQLPWPSEGQAYMAAAGLGTLGQSGEQKPVPIASVTKSMTAYIILRDHPFKKGEKGAMIDVDKIAESEGQKDKSDNESTLNTVKEGDKISEYDAIAALMIPSANNIARLLARWDSGTQEAFVKKMNDTAKDLGMTNTTYTDPSGLDATTVSTAEDQVKLGLKIVEMDAMIDITRKPSWIDPSGKKWDNWNRLVPGNDSLGIKTGTTTKAGGNLLFAAQKKIGNTNQLIVGAVLGQHKAPIIDTVIAASKQLLIATQKSLDGAVVVKKGEVVGYVDDGFGGQAPVVATADVQAVGWASLTVNVKLSSGGVIPQTAKAGTEMGVLTVGEGASQVKVPVALKDDLLAPTIGSKLTRVG